MLMQADECQLVLVDYQSRLMPAIHDGAGVLAQAQKLAKVRWHKSFSTGSFSPSREGFCSVPQIGTCKALATLASF